MKRHIITSALLATALLAPAFSEAPATIPAKQLAFFENHIRPLFAEHCFRCHSQEVGKQKGGLLLDRKAGWMTGGDSGGSVIDLEQPEQSLLYLMVRHDPDVEAMPPKSKISDAEAARILEWITMGAPDPRNEALDESLSHDEFDLEARKEFWSLQPLAPTKAPATKNTTWPRNDIDRFILAKLEDKNWQPATPADKATLLRRASITLTGLTPTPEELNTFLDDKREDAFEHQVDRLLASLHFGERFARHWMDVVRFANSKAFEVDYTIPYTAEYRDYLIRLFNDDVPYDQMVREAFAGDLLPQPRIKDGINESLIGPGGLLFTDGQHGPPDIHEDEARVFDGMINTATVAFQSLTVACARCHDHKFDAVTAADYYSMYGMLRSSRLDYANCAVTPPETLKTLRKTNKNAEDELLATATISDFVIHEALELLADKDLVDLHKKAYHDKDEATRVEGQKEYNAKIAELAPDLAAWYRFLKDNANIPELNPLRRAITQSGPETKPLAAATTFTWRSDDPNTFEPVEQQLILTGNSTAPVLAGIENGLAAGHLSPRLEGRLRSEDFIIDGHVHVWVKSRDVAVKLIVRNYEMAGLGITSRALRHTPAADSWQRLTFKTEFWKGEPAYLEILHHGGSGMHCGNHGGAPDDSGYAIVANEYPAERWNKIWDNAQIGTIPETIRTLFSRRAHFDVLGELIKHGLVTFKTDTVKALADARNAIPRPRYVRTLTEGQNYNEPVYVRGNHKALSKKPNPKHFLDAYGGQTIGKTGSGRLEYADHLLTTAAPLTARVRVNRLWTRVFGQGLVASVDDLGVMGQKPSHPQLLDTLAEQFMEQGWSTKTLLRELVTSSTFRMSSLPGDGVNDADPKNTLLQHMPIQRMDAESIRDHILQASGRLNRRVFGRIVSRNDQSRRSLYLDMKRNNLPTFLRTFDMPLFTEPVGVRLSSTVPAQSLALLNDPFTHSMATHWSRTLKQKTDEEKINALHLAAFSRPATDAEIKWAKHALAELNNNWSDLCHLMINRKEFIYVF